MDDSNDLPQTGDHRAERLPRWHPRSRSEPGAVPDLEFLRRHPSLAAFRGSGWRLDRLPAASTGLAFGGALLVSLLAFGVAGGLVVVLALVLALPLAASALIQQDVGAARGVLCVARAALLTWAVVAAVFLHPALSHGAATVVARG